MIPKKIHYCWFGGNPMPNIVKKCIKSWKKKCPDYEIVLWNEENFDINCNSFVKKAHEMKAWAFVSDYARLKIVYDNGGIYLDTDVEVLKNLDELLNNKAFFGVQQCEKQINTGLCFGAEKNNDIIKKMLDIYANIKFENDKKEQFLCPILNTNVLEKIGYNYSNEIQEIKNKILIYPPKYFDPIAPGNSENLLSKDSFSIHHYSATWTNTNNKIKRKIINFIGQKKINYIKKIIRRM